MICAPRRWTASVSCTLLLLSGLASAQTIYVDASNPNCPGTGTQTDPYCLIQTAIGAANTGDTVLVAPGTYLENVDFLGKAIEVRSSNGPGVTTIDGNLLGSAVAFRTGEGPLSKLSGFRIQNGSGTPCGVGTTCGGGIVCDGSSPSIEGNELVQNNATFGGGILCLNLAAPAIVNNTISSNTAQNSNGGVGCLYGAAPVIRGNTISSNSATYASGGVGAYLSSPHIVGNDITGNSVTRYMGGVGAIAGNPIIERNHIEGNTSSYVMGGIGCANGAAPIITGNTITANRAIRLSGGVGLAYGASATLANNTITNNVAGSAAGVGCFYASTATIVNDTLSGNQAYFAPGGGIVVDAGSTVNVTNAILWYNVPLETFNLGGTININTSDVRGGYPGTGNIAADPLFVSSATGDFRLTCASPCVDAGNGSPGIPLPLFDQSGLDLRQIGPIDMGSDEAGALWQVNGPVRPGGPAVTATVTAVPSHPRGTAEIQFSLMPQTGADGIFIPCSNGRYLPLAQTGLQQAWTFLPTSFRQAPVNGCTGASTAPFTLPAAFPVGVTIYYAGFTWDGITRQVQSITPPGSFATQ